MNKTCRNLMHTQNKNAVLSKIDTDRKTLEVLSKLKRGILLAFLVLLFLCSATFSKDHSNNRNTQGDVNDNAQLSLNVPLGSYEGRGIDLPITLSYSGAVWNIEHLGNFHPSTGVTQTVTEARFSKNAVAGWKSSLSLPIIEFPKDDTHYDYQGMPTKSPSSGCSGYRVREVYLTMPDGSTHVLRKNDTPSQSPNSVDRDGTFYAIDGSRIRFDSTHSSVGAGTGTIYTPDGTQFYLGTTSATITDKNGNSISYDKSTRTWTDVVGRNIQDPLSAPSTPDEINYVLPGLTGSDFDELTYKFKWEKLEDSLTPIGGSTPALRVMGSEVLPYPNSLPGSGNQPVAETSPYEPLFKSTPFGYGENGPVYPVLIVGKGESITGGQLFNPIVLTKITLPDGTSYKFSYNVYGEIDRVISPTGSVDSYEFTGAAPATSVPEEFSEDDYQPFIQAMRWVTSRKQSVTGLGDDIREWKYLNSPNMDGGGSTFVIAPDKSRTEIYRYGPGAKTTVYFGSGGQSTREVFPFGFKDPRVSQVREKRIYSSSVDGLSGNLMRREISEYEYSTFSYYLSCQMGQGPAGARSKTHYISRTPRLSRVTAIMLEGTGSALATTTTFSHDLSNEMTTGIDQILASAYDFEVISYGTATANNLADNLASNVPLGTKIREVETSYLTGTAYTNAYLFGLPTIVTVKNGSNHVVSRHETTYDDPGFVPTGTHRGLPTSERRWDSSKDVVTNPSAYVVSTAKFDSWGNQIETVDAMGRKTTTTYDSTYHIFPEGVLSPAPDLSGAKGSATGMSSSTTFDYISGLVISATDINGQSSTYEYNDPLLRRTRTIAGNGSQTITEYPEPDSSGDIPANEKYIKTRSQHDTDKWIESKSWIDGLGRVWKTEDTRQGEVITKEDLFDDMGRIEKSSDPYKVGDTIRWTEPTYDSLGRVIKTKAPDQSEVNFSFGLSTTGVIGITKVVEDQAGRKRKGITDALGNVVRVIEDPDNAALTTDYVFDLLGNLRKTTQGDQQRYFYCDSLGRVRFSKLVEQADNSSLSIVANTDPITGNYHWSTKYVYDDNGNIVSTTDANNDSISVTYDALNRIILRDYSDVNTPDVHFYYDGAGLSSPPNFSMGQTTKIVSSVSETRFTSFNSSGQVTSSEQRTTEEQLAGTEPGYIFSYVYNLSGALIEEVYPSGRIVKQSYDNDGQINRLQSKKNTASGYWTYADNFKWDPTGELTRVQLGNGHWETKELNNRQQVVQIGLGRTATTQDLFKLELGYTTTTLSDDNNGSLKSQKITVPTIGAAAGFQATQIYTYDSLNRLETAVETVGGNTSWAQGFNYDRFGNRTFNEATTTTLPKNCSGNTTVCSADHKKLNPDVSTSNNRIITDQDGDSLPDYEYDNAGSLTKDSEGARFGYDAEQHQTKYFDKLNAGTTPDVRYYYDGSGKRVKKVSSSETTIFVYDVLGRLAGEYSTTSSTKPQVSYITTDHLGSTRVITDQAGSIASRKDFDAFGDESKTPTIRRTDNGYVPTGIRKDYTGYEFDEESGLQFAQARYYNTRMGRFTSVDPMVGSATVRDPQSFNRYSYVLNSPYKFTDPLGLMAQGTAAASGVCSSQYSACVEDGADPFAQEAVLQARKTQQTNKQTQPKTNKKTTEKNTGKKTVVVKKATKTTTKPKAAPKPPAPGTPEVHAQSESLKIEKITGVDKLPYVAGVYKQTIFITDTAGNPVKGTVSESVKSTDSSGKTVVTNTGNVPLSPDGGFTDIVDAGGVTVTPNVTEAQARQVVENTAYSSQQEATFTVKMEGTTDTLTIVQTRKITNTNVDGTLRPANDPNVPNNGYRVWTKIVSVTRNPGPAPKK